VEENGRFRVIAFDYDDAPQPGGRDAQTHPFPIFPAPARERPLVARILRGGPLLITLTTGTATAAATPSAALARDPAVITDWNAIAVATLSADTTKQGVETILYTAFVQAAVYNAVVGIEGRYAPYRFHGTHPAVPRPRRPRWPPPTRSW
jgi:hypothetical protein